MMSALILWIPTKAFTSFLINENNGFDKRDMEAEPKPNCTGEWKRIDNYFSALKQLTALITKIFGKAVILFLLESLLNYGASIDDLVLQQVNTDWKLLCLDIIYFTLCHFIIIFSADVCCLANKLKEWLSVDKNREQVSTDKLIVTLDELNANMVGIKGSNLLTITYSLIGNVRKRIVVKFCVRDMKTLLIF